MRELQNAVEDERWVEVAAAQRIADSALPIGSTATRAASHNQQQQQQDITDEGWLPT